MTNKQNCSTHRWRFAIVAIAATLCLCGCALFSTLGTQSALAEGDSSESTVVKVTLNDPQGYSLGTSQSLDKETYHSGDTVVLTWRGAANGTDFVMPTSIKYGDKTIAVDSLNKVDDMQSENSEYLRRMGQSQAITDYNSLKEYVTKEHFFTITNVTLDTQITITWQKVRPVYRMYNMITSEHLFTTNQKEYNNLVRLGYTDKDFWIGEGINWLAPAQTGENVAVVHRFYNEGLGGMGSSSHYYSANEEEIATLKQNGWVDDGEDNQVLSGGNTAIWTCYNEALGSAHHYTSNKSEWSGLKTHGWDLEEAKNGTNGVLQAVMGTGWSFDGNFYTVRHNLQNADGDGYTTYASTSVSGKSGAKTEAKANDYTGYTAQKITQATIAADNSTVVEINYDRTKYSLTYVTNGGSEVKATDVSYGDKLTKPTDPDYDGFDLVGWYYDKDCTDSNAVNWSKDTMPLGNVTLYAKWESKEKVTVTYNMQGKCENISLVIGKGSKAEHVTPVCDVNNSRFAGWYAEAECTTPINFDDTVDASVTYYAKWIDSITVTYNMQGKCDNVVKTIDKGTKPDNITPECASEDLRFDGWYTDADLTTKVDFTKGVEADSEFFAKWTEFVNVTYNMQGKCDNEVKKFEKGTKATDLVPECTLEDYTFRGWYAEADCKTKIDFEQPVEADAEYYALWTEKVTVTFVNGGHGNSLDPVKVDEGGTLAQPTDEQVGTSEGLKLEGWYTNIYREEATKFDFANTVINTDTTLYANWVPDSDADVYWLGPARLRTTGNTSETVDVKNANYIKEEWNVKKSSAELKADVQKIIAGDQTTIDEYKEWMNCECYHLYTKWNGDKTDGSGKESALNGYVEFRILQVGSHDGDGAAITFQAIHELPAGSDIAAEGFKAGWGTSDLRTELQSGGSIYNNFNKAFTDDIATIAKKTTLGNGSKEVITAADKFFLTSQSEVMGISNSINAVDEGSQYDYFTLMKLSKTDNNEALERGTRSGDSTKVNPAGTESDSCNWWTRTASVETVGEFLTIDVGAATGSKTADSVYGVVPTFAFGTSVKDVVVNYDMQGRCENLTKSVAVGEAPENVTPECTVSGLKFDGWYKDSKCSVKFDFAKDVANMDMTLYANWVPDTNTSAYWLAPASSSITTNSSKDYPTYGNNSNYAGAETNVKKTAEEIKKDVETLKNENSTDYAKVKAEWEGYMKNDDYHLYTKWNGDKKNSKGEDAPSNGYVEFRVLQVGSHDGDGSVLTFQSAYMLPVAYAVVDSSSESADWAVTDLRKRLQPATQSSGADATTPAATATEGEIYNNFDANFTKDIMTSSKKYISGYVKKTNSSTSTTEVTTEIKTSSDKFFVLSNSEIVAGDATTANAADESEGTQYAFYSDKNINKGNVNSALWLLTRAADWYPTDSSSKDWKQGAWWQRTPMNYAEYLFTQMGNPGAYASINSKYGVVPCFAFGTDAKDANGLTVDLAGELNYNNSEQTQNITVKDADTTLVEGTDYKVTGNKATTEGEHKLTVIGLGKYAGSKEVTYKINGSKAETSAAGVATVYDSTIEGDNKQVTVTVTATNVEEKAPEAGGDSSSGDGGNTDSSSGDGSGTDGGNTDGGNTDGGNTDGSGTDAGSGDGGNAGSGDSSEALATVSVAANEGDGSSETTPESSTGEAVSGATVIVEKGVYTIKMPDVETKKSVSVKIADSTDQSLSNKTVNLKDKDDADLGQQTTDSEGNYSFDLVKITYDMQEKCTNVVKTIAKGGKAENLVPECDPQGVRFDAWYTKKDSTGETDKVNFEETITEDKTFYAKWIETVKVTYNMQGKCTDEVKTVDKDQKADNVTPQCETPGYKFDGWYEEAECKTKVELPKEVSTDTTYYAKWTETVTVTFNFQGKCDDVVKTVDKGSEVTKQDVSSECQTPGFRFDDWYTEKECTNKATFNQKVETDTTYYAKWVETVKVTFSFQGKCDEKTETVDKGATVKEPTPECKVEGLKIEGWYKDSKCSSDAKVDLTKDTFDADTALYANWTLDTTASSTSAYWLAPASTTITKETTGRAPYFNNSEYVGPEVNVKKTQKQIQEDVKALQDTNSDKHATVKAEYEGYMNSDSFHLYTKWNGDKTASTGKDENLNGYVEFRIINVGTHDDDGSVLTFQSAYILPTAYAVYESGSSTSDWANSSLRAKLQAKTDASTTAAADTTDDNIFAKFDTGFTNDIMTVSKKYTDGYKRDTSASETTTEIKTSNDKFFLLAYSEVTPSDTSDATTTDTTDKSEGSQYGFYKDKNVVKDNSNSCLSLLTRAGEYNAAGSTSYSWWLRTPKNYATYYFSQFGHPSAFGALDAKGGVVPCFAFGKAKTTDTTNPETPAETPAA